MDVLALVGHWAIYLSSKKEWVEVRQCRQLTGNREPGLEFRTHRLVEISSKHH